MFDSDREKLGMNNFATVIFKLSQSESQKHNAVTNKIIFRLTDGWLYLIVYLPKSFVEFQFKEKDSNA